MILPLQYSQSTSQHHTEGRGPVLFPKAPMHVHMHMHILSQEDQILIDGTFRITPALWKQVVIRMDTDIKFTLKIAHILKLTCLNFFFFQYSGQ